MTNFNKKILAVAIILTSSFSFSAIAAGQSSYSTQIQKAQEQRSQEFQTSQVLPGGIVHSTNPDGSMSAQSKDGYSITEKNGVTTGHFPDGRKLIRYKNTGQVLMYYPNGQYVDITDKMGDPSYILSASPQGNYPQQNSTNRGGSGERSTERVSELQQQER